MASKIVIDGSSRCQTSLVAEARRHYTDQFTFEGNRALLFKLGEPLPRDPLRHCISRTLTYHLRSGHSQCGFPKSEYR